ncbi:MAG: phage major capsid protein [Chthoniobacterales bacterium]
MNRKAFPVIVALLISFGANPCLRGADANVETKLREQLRATLLQLRSLQNEKATLQAQSTENEEKVKALTAQVTSLTKQAADAEKTGADQATEIAKYKEALDKWKVAYQQASDVATAKETERAKLSEKSILLDRRVADLQTRNDALFRLGNEILRRYERFSLGDALAAKEPFTGLTRVKLENLVQNYDDKLAEQKARP